MKMIKMMMMLLLQVMVIYATSAAAGTGLETTCKKKTPNVEFCTELLTPYAAHFADNDAYQIGFAALSATVGQVRTMKALMVGKSTEPGTSEADKAALKESLAQVVKCDDSLRKALAEFDKTRHAAKTGGQNVQNYDAVITNIDAARDDLIAGVDLLKKNKGSKTIGEVVLQVDRSVKACFLAHALLH